MKTCSCNNFESFSLNTMFNVFMHVVYLILYCPANKNRIKVKDKTLRKGANLVQLHEQMILFVAP